MQKVKIEILGELGILGLAMDNNLNYWEDENYYEGGEDNILSTLVSNLEYQLRFEKHEKN